MRVQIEGVVQRVFAGSTAKGTAYSDVTLLQAAQGERGEPQLVKVRCWNGHKAEVGKPFKADVVVRLLAGRDAQGRPYPPRITVDAF